MSRVICWFSCGAASAVATKLAIAKHGSENLVVAYTHVLEEHPDNWRFLRDCKNWFGCDIEILGNDKYNRSIYEVFMRTRYLKGTKGTACTRLLKKEVRKKFQNIDDVHVFGYTV